MEDRKCLYGDHCTAKENCNKFGTVSTKGTKYGPRRCADYKPEVDRDELIRVADEISGYAECIAGYLDSCEGNFSEDDASEYYKFAGWADRIRKALGVER